MANLEGGDQPCRTLERLGLDLDAREVSAR
jgi:hypothetical protein